jgi:hypothetical protein
VTLKASRLAWASPPPLFGTGCPAGRCRLWKQASAETSGRGRAVQQLAPMRNPLLERAFAPVGQLLEIDLFEDLGGEIPGCGAKTAVFAYSFFA